MLACEILGSLLPCDGLAGASADARQCVMQSIFYPRAVAAPIAKNGFALNRCTVPDLWVSIGASKVKGIKNSSPHLLIKRRQRYVSGQR
jgi:hypothetical protein